MTLPEQTATVGHSTNATASWVQKQALYCCASLVPLQGLQTASVDCYSTAPATRIGTFDEFPLIETGRDDTHLWPRRTIRHCIGQLWAFLRPRPAGFARRWCRKFIQGWTAHMADQHIDKMLWQHLASLGVVCQRSKSHRPIGRYDDPRSKNTQQISSWQKDIDASCNQQANYETPPF